MKIEYTCDICGKRYPTSGMADMCEKGHSAQKRREELREKSSRAISELYEKHIKEFGEIPELSLSEEGRELATKFVVKKFAGLMDDLGESLAEIVEEDK